MKDEITETFPNIFTSDNNNSTSKLEYNFNMSNELIYYPQGNNNSINSRFYFKPAVLLENKNVKYNNKTYTFNGFYISNRGDIVDKVKGEDYYLIIENVIQTTNTYLYISIPLLKSKINTPINKLLTTLFLDGSHDITSSDINFNTIIPQSHFYSYSAINKNITDNNMNVIWILFNTSSIYVNYKQLDSLQFLPQPTNDSNKYKLLDDVYYFKVGPPLSLSTSISKKRDSLTNYVKDEVYMQCDEVQDITIAPKKLFYYNLFDTKNKIYSPDEGGIFEIIVYVIIFLIIIFGLFKGTMGS